MRGDGSNLVVVPRPLKNQLDRLVIAVELDREVATLEWSKYLAGAGHLDFHTTDI